MRNFLLAETRVLKILRKITNTQVLLLIQRHVKKTSASNRRIIKIQYCRYKYENEEEVYDTFFEPAKNTQQCKELQEQAINIYESM